MQAVPRVEVAQRRLAAAFPNGLPGREAWVRTLAARTVQTALFVGAVGDPADPETPLMRPSMVCWLGEPPLARADDEDFRRSWHLKASANRKALAVWLRESHVLDDVRYADNTRESIRDEVLRPWRTRFGAVLRRNDVSPTSGRPSMALAPDFAALFDPDLRDEEVSALIAAWRAAHLGPSAQAQLHAQRQLSTAAASRVRLPGRGDRALPLGESGALMKAFVETAAPRLLKDPYVLAICHSGDPTADDDRNELERAGLSLDRSLALPDLILLDAGSGDFWFTEVVVTDGPVDDPRREDLIAWAASHGVAADRCHFATVFTSRGSQAFRRSVSRLAWGSVAWFNDEPNQLLRLAALRA